MVGFQSEGSEADRRVSVAPEPRRLDSLIPTLMPSQDAKHEAAAPATGLLVLASDRVRTPTGGVARRGWPQVQSQE
jgi:hypothetical protein